MKSELPKIEPKKCSEMYKLLKEMVPYYTPEWAGSDDAGIALLKIFSYINETVIDRLNQAPKKNFVAFLDMLGIKLLPAQPARVPLTFRLSDGTEDEILVPDKTQAAADKTTEHEEILFETKKNLQATPSQLTNVFSVDPLEDAIYQPPPGFLNGNLQEEIQVSYKIVSSPSKGSKNFQLDHVTGLEAGDFLCIGKHDKEYIIISEISGLLVYITDPLLHDYPSDTLVEKITKFNVFEAKNVQEHSLYLGHKDLFNIKSNAKFTLFINHRQGTETGLTPLKLSWQYWGEVEGEEGESWHEFTTMDNTHGLSRSETIKLNKIIEGEIKEKEIIKDIKSRWIRCIVKESLGVPRKLPILDNVVFNVRSSGENLLPDLAFNNETPLDITESFTPFGNEPRMFDNFFIASKEVYSKKGAKIEMDIKVEKRGILSQPTAISVDGNEKIKIFARGTNGRLIEVEIDLEGNEEPLWTDHGFPLDTKIYPNSTLCAKNYGSYISVFARAKNGHLVERIFNETQWVWQDNNMPENVNIISDPIAIYESEMSDLSVFVTGSDGNLYEFYRKISTGSLIGIWINHGRPNGRKIVSSPYGDSYLSGSRAKMFVHDQDGNLFELDSKLGSNDDDTWVKDYPPLPNGMKPDSKSFVQIYSLGQSGQLNGDHATVLVRDNNDTLWKYYTFLHKLDQTIRENNDKWIPLESPDGNIKISSNPCGYIEDPDSMDGRISETTYPPDPETVRPEKQHIFVRGTDNNLWERDDLKWIPHQSPANSKPIMSPFVIYESHSKYLHIVLASSQNSIIERRIELDQSNTWNEYRDPNETALTPTLSWEYWNRNGWIVLKSIKDGTSNLLKSGKITFDLPEDIDETKVAGQKSSWIRVRIVGGDYGKETFSLLEDRDKGREQKVISTKNSIRPPIINKLTMSYSLETKQYPQYCLSYNNLEYLDHTEASKIEDKFFKPFVQLEDRTRTLYLGFEKSIKGGPISIFFSAKELPFTEEKKPKLEWTYSRKDNWKELKGYRDYTEGLIMSDILEFIGDLNFSAKSRFGNYLYWIKGNLVKDEYEESPLLDGIYPNTTWAQQAETIRDEILGTSNGEANQEFSLLRFPVLEGQEIRVREILSEEKKQEIIAYQGQNSIQEVKDEKGKVIETWIKWSEVPDFFISNPLDRHYILDRATGQIQFGNGIKGMIPQIQDNNIKAVSYQTGGGKQGNVSAGEIKTLKSSVAGVDSIINPVAADGGADTATLDEMLEIGPAMIDHRDRAVTEEDFEWLAKQASRKVVNARCLSNTNNKRQKSTGWVTVIIVPDSLEAKPCPSLELRKIVRRYLEERSANTLMHNRHIDVDGPSYVEIGVSVDVFVTSRDKASQVEREVKKELDAFFHPLTGGPEKKGWDFGRDATVSDIYALLESIEGVDHLENMELTHNYESCQYVFDQNSESKGEQNNKIVCEYLKEEIVKVNENVLIANGTHTINLQTIKERGDYEST
ncbi:MAG: putative baseplate assembly protein [Candidatus Omnitrophica bacterium]|nr:putative baseplate assembly protein [Candidatus Omnitrophota bacterium]